MKRFTGLIPPMVTPLAAPDKLDVASTKRMVRHLVDGGVDGIFLLGTTGEGPHLPYAIREELVKVVCSAVKGKVPVLVGITETDMEDALAFAAKCKAFGAAGVVAAPPYYFKLTQDEGCAWFRELADRSPLPLVIYDMPAHTDTIVEPATVAKLARHPNIVGMKDSENNIGRLEECLKLFADRKDFCYFCGCAANSAVALKNGADGIVPSVGNFLPKMYQDLYEAGIRGDEAEAERLQQETIEIGKINTAGLTLGESLAGLKVICNMIGLCDTYMWPPLTELAPEVVERIKKEATPVIKQNI